MKLLTSLLFLISVNLYANTLDELLLTVKSQQQQTRLLESERKQQFSGDLSEWQASLNKAQQRLAMAKQQAQTLGLAFDDNEKKLAQLATDLELAKDNLGELFGVVRQVSGEFAADIEQSVISVQYPERLSFVTSLSKRKALPSLAELEQLWFVIQQEMTESAKISTFKTTVLDSSGLASKQTVTRFGAFNLVDDTQYLVLNKQSQLPQPLTRPVPAEVKTTFDHWLSSNEPVKAFYFDPAKGDLLKVLSRTPTWSERFQQGGVIGYLIFAILIFGLIVALVRFIVLSKESLKIKAQLGNTQASLDNSLGRIFAIYQANKKQNTQVLELKVEEAVLREIPRLERGSSVLKVLAAIAPMMGLLGTVTGMIATFQSITLFGTGDPKLMAGGISMALITTVMGLIAALPLLLIHSLLHSRANSLINILEQQSAGLIALQAEAETETESKNNSNSQIQAVTHTNKKTVEQYELVS